MSAITKLLKNEETPLGRAVYFTHLHCTADKELGEDAAAELARLQEERLEIAESIHATLDDGEAPDNLAECVSYLMLQEYYPMRATIDRLTAELKALRQA